MTATLYGLKHSHPVLAVRLMLEAAGVEHRVRNIFPGLHGVAVKAAGFPRWNVPALKLDGQRFQGTVEIARELDRRFPDAGLYPSDADQRRAVEDAERWGHDEPQAVARRLFRWAGVKDNGVRAWMADQVIGAPAPTAVGYAFKPAMVFFAWRVGAAKDEATRRDLAGLPALLDHADALVAAGTIGGATPNAADFQILTSLRLLMAHEDLRPLVESRPCGQAALRLLPDYPRSGAEALTPVPAAFPREWLPAD